MSTSSASSATWYDLEGECGIRMPVPRYHRPALGTHMPSHVCHRSVLRIMCCIRAVEEPKQQVQR